MSTLFLEYDSCDTCNVDLSLNCYLCDFTKYDQRDTSMTFDTSAKKLARNTLFDVKKAVSKDN